MFPRGKPKFLCREYTVLHRGNAIAKICNRIKRKGIKKAAKIVGREQHREAKRLRHKTVQYKG
jgi:hypothetical protein